VRGGINSIPPGYGPDHLYPVITKHKLYYKGSDVCSKNAKNFLKMKRHCKMDCEKVVKYKVAPRNVKG